MKTKESLNYITKDTVVDKKAEYMLLLPHGVGFDKIRYKAGTSVQNVSIDKDFQNVVFLIEGKPYRTNYSWALGKKTERSLKLLDQLETIDQVILQAKRIRDSIMEDLNEFTLSDVKDQTPSSTCKSGCKCKQKRR